MLKYIKLNRHQYDHIAFINASSAETITQDYAKYLDVDNDENTISNMSHWSSVNEKWLFVYDNIDDDCLKSDFFIIDFPQSLGRTKKMPCKCKSDNSRSFLHL